MKGQAGYEERTPMLQGSGAAWNKFVGSIRQSYTMEELWTEGKPESPYRHELKFRRGGKTLVTLYLREGFFRVCIILGKHEREKFEKAQAEFSGAVRAKYCETNTLHDGKWLSFDVYNDEFIDDLMRLLYLKRKPNRGK